MGRELFPHRRRHRGLKAILDLHRKAPQFAAGKLLGPRDGRCQLSTRRGRLRLFVNAGRRIVGGDPMVGWGKVGSPDIADVAM